jgi:hypothetical protein
MSRGAERREVESRDERREIGRPVVVETAMTRQATTRSARHDTTRHKLLPTLTLFFFGELLLSLKAGQTGQRQGRQRPGPAFVQRSFVREQREEPAGAFIGRSSGRDRWSWGGRAGTASGWKAPDVVRG